MRIAFADPPYIGCAHLYKDHPDYAGEVDHVALVDRLQADYDGWVLHAGAHNASEEILAPMMARLGARKCVWVKQFAAFKRNVPVAYAWEPVYEECLTWPFGRDGRGYADIHNPGGTRKAHRIVCEMAHGEPPAPDYQAAHTCGKGHLGCVNPGHLEWKTSSQNQLDRIAHDTHLRGTRNVNAKFNEGDIREIRAIPGEVSNAEVARRYHVNHSTISSIRRRKTWDWLE